MKYYISDLHFFHEDMNKNMDRRGFDSVEAMNAHMIGQWNKKVKKNDETVILGDFSFGKPAETEEVLKALNGKKYMIIGNHDRFLTSKKFDTSLFKWIDHYHEIKDNKRNVILSHYPIFCYKGQNYYDENGNAKTYMLYGHVHNTFDEILVNKFQNISRSMTRPEALKPEKAKISCQMINCFCMFSDYMPLSLDEWIELDAKRRAEMPDLSI